MEQAEHCSLLPSLNKTAAYEVLIAETMPFYAVAYGQF